MILINHSEKMKIKPQRNLRHKGTEIAIAVIAKHCNNIKRRGCPIRGRVFDSEFQKLRKMNTGLGLETQNQRRDPLLDSPIIFKQAGRVIGITMHSFGMLAITNQVPFPRYPVSPFPPFIMGFEMKSKT